MEIKWTSWFLHWKVKLIPNMKSLMSVYSSACKISFFSFNGHQVWAFHQVPRNLARAVNEMIVEFVARSSSIMECFSISYVDTNSIYASICIASGAASGAAGEKAGGRDGTLLRLPQRGRRLHLRRRARDVQERRCESLSITLVLPFA